MPELGARWHAMLSEMGFQHQIYDENGNGIAGVYNYIGEEAGKQNARLIAAAPELCDELTSLSRAVAAYLNVDSNDDDGHERLRDEMEVMLQRAERVLGRLPPMKGHAPDCGFFSAQAAGMQRPSGACGCGYIDHDDDDH